MTKRKSEARAFKRETKKQLDMKSRTTIVAFAREIIRRISKNDKSRDSRILNLKLM